MGDAQGLIRARDLRKVFRVPVRKTGPFAAVRQLVSRDYKDVTAVGGVDFGIDAGEVVGYLGPNGAGKSTTLKMLTGILVPSGGTLTVAGRVPHRQRTEHVRGIGVVFGQRSQLWYDLPTIESFELLRHIYRIPHGQWRSNLDRFSDLLELGPFLGTPVRQLSLGQRMRADLAAALLHDPEILFLDEPTIGLDVVAKERIRQFLAHLNRERGVTILLTTHDITDIERLCPRVILIDHGRVVFDGELEALRARFGGQRTLLVDLEAPVVDIEVPHAAVTRVEGPRVWLRFDRDAVSASDLIAEVASRYRVRDLTLEEAAIEEVIRRIYEGDATNLSTISAGTAFRSITPR